MNVGERIRERLTALEMSQSELARRVSVTQSTIAGLVLGKSRSSAHLHRIARELGTTPSYLIGETDDPDQDAPAPAELDSLSREVIDNLSTMTDADRRALLQISRSLAANASPADEGATVHAPSKSYRGPPPVAPALPPESAMAEMFEALLDGIDRRAPASEQARLLAQRLPIGLSQLQDLRPAPDRDPTPDTAPTVADAGRAKRRREPTS